jgi:hypothetical protein
VHLGRCDAKRENAEEELKLRQAPRNFLEDGDLWEVTVKLAR